MKKIVLTLGLCTASPFAGDMNDSMMDHSKHKNVVFQRSSFDGT